MSRTISSLVSSDQRMDFHSLFLCFRCLQSNSSLALACSCLSLKFFTRVIYETSSPEEAGSATIIFFRHVGILFDISVYFPLQSLENIELLTILKFGFDRITTSNFLYCCNDSTVHRQMFLTVWEWKCRLLSDKNPLSFKV